MNFFSPNHIIAGLLLFCLAGFAQDQQDSHQTLEKLMPLNYELAGWTADGEAEIAIGEDLHLLINGGAEIYHEYGFKRAIFKRYKDEMGSALNLEIYEMENSQAAHGLYSFKTGNDGKPINIEKEGWLENYFLNFWKAKYVVTIVSFNLDRDITKTITEMAELVASKISGSSQKTILVSYLPMENILPNGLTYIKGNLALFNHYFFGENTVFGFSDGILARYEKFSIFIFRYNSSHESNSWFKIARSKLEQNVSFTNFIDRGTEFEICDVKKSNLRIRCYKRFILIVLGKKNINYNAVFRLLETGINSSN